MIDEGPEATDDAAEDAADCAAKRPLSTEVVVVGIGASAGGLEALREMVSSLPRNSRLAYVVAQHLSPSHRSMLMELLARETSMPVQNLNRPIRPRANTIYITPPNRDVEMVGGTLRLRTPLLPSGPKPSIDRFFSSLAYCCGEESVAVVLSGTGSDGAVGIRAVKAAGGLALAQKPETARFPGMPQAAMDTGCVDLVLPAEELGRRIADLVAMPHVEVEDAQRNSDSDPFQKVISSLRSITNIDLAEYRHGTLRRRIRRRMTLLGLNNIEDYCERLQNEEVEARQLVRDAFINVTGFFRDQAAFAALEAAAKALVARKPQNSSIRAWVAGCSSGEEAYSVAMVLDEAIRNAGGTHRLQVFATDVVGELTEKARHGVFPATAVANIGEARLSRYFTPLGANYQVSKELRRMVLFAHHNLIEDPPFSKLDLISCRNVLIYFSPTLQRRALTTFAYSLNPGGLLFLGKSETPSGNQDLFTAVERQAKLFQLRPSKAVLLPPMPQMAAGMRTAESRRAEQRPEDRIMALLARTYAPPNVVIEGNGHVVHFFGDLTPFLRFPQGPAQLSVFELLDGDRRIELRAILHRCQRQRAPVHGEAFSRPMTGAAGQFQMWVRPLDAGEAQPSLFSVSFESLAVAAGESAASSSELTNTQRVVELEHELVSSREHLQTVVEELEASNEELQSVNEELMSSNEELQSTNEELETANEELQSTNEELLTINEELDVKTSALELANSDLENILECLDSPLMVVDRKLRLMRYNRACEQVFDLASAATGASIATLAWRLDLADLRAKVADTIAQGRSLEQELRHGERTLTLRVQSYRDGLQSHGGAIIHFSDTSAVNAAQSALRRWKARTGALLENMPLAVQITDADGRTQQVNAPFERLYGVSRTVLIGRRMEEVFTGRLAEIAHQHEETVCKGGQPACFRETLIAGGIERTLLSVRFPVQDERGELIGSGAISADVTDLDVSEEALRNAEEEHLLESRAALVFLTRLGRGTESLAP